MKFVIVSGQQFWGGTIVAHYLCKLLEKRGYQASIFYVGPTSEKRIKFTLFCIYSVFREYIGKIHAKLLPNSSYGRKHDMGYIHVPVKGCKRKWFPYVDDDTIVIYTETIVGNPLHAANVVRWLLFYNRFPNDDSWYNMTDLFFTYRSQFNDPRLNPEGRILHIFHFDKELYKQTNFGRRQGNCYIIRKGMNRKELPTAFDGPIIDDLRETDKVKILNQCEKCYLYDTQSFYASIAAICGCIPIIVPEPGKTKKDYVKPEDKVCGRAYGDTEEEIQYAIQTRDDVMKQVDEMLSDNEKQVTSFIKTCKEYFHLA